MSRSTNPQRFERAPGRHGGGAGHAAESRREELRQSHLAHTPEGTEPTPRVRRLSWMLFGTTAAVALIAMFVVLGATWGWVIAVVGVGLVVAMYFLTFWPYYAAWGLRHHDRVEADRKIERGEPVPGETGPGPTPHDASSSSDRAGTGRTETRVRGSDSGYSR